MELGRSFADRLGSHPAPALPTPLLEESAEETLPEELSPTPLPFTEEDLLRRAARRFPGRFRVVCVWRGSWRNLAATPEDLPDPLRKGLRGLGWTSALWVIPLGTPAEEDAGRFPRLLLRCVRLVIRSLEEESEISCLRWIILVEEFRRAYPKLVILDETDRSTTPPPRRSGPR